MTIATSIWTEDLREWVRPNFSIAVHRVRLGADGGTLRDVVSSKLATTLGHDAGQTARSSTV